MPYSPGQLARVDQYLSRICEDVTTLSEGCRGCGESVADVDLVADQLRQFTPETVLVMLAVALIRLGKER